MAGIEIMDKERADALSYVVSKRYGYVRELLDTVKQTIVDEFVSLGFIIMGYTYDDKTWRASSLADSYFQIVF